MGASAYHLFKRTAEREFFTRSMRSGQIWATVGIVFTVGFGYGQFGPLGQVQPGKLDLPAVRLPLELMTLVGELAMFALLLVLLPVIKWLPRWRWLHPLFVVLIPVPFIAAVLGWLVRELGRQPWLVQGKLTVADAMSP